MREFDPRKALIFIHIPKTAGTAVRKVMDQWFADQIHEHYYNERKSRMPIKTRLKPRKFWKKPPVIYGHFNRNRGFGVEDYYPDATQFLTILRDPFETVVSGYFYVRKTSDEWIDQSRVPTQSLEDHLRTAEPNILNHFPRRMTAENYKDIIEEMFIDIGITESLGPSLQKMAGKLGKSFDPATLKVVNVTQRDQSVTDAHRDQFLEKHPLEVAVYDYVKSRLMES